jgi:hypothetical protein
VCANTQRVVDEFFVNMQLKFEITIKDEVDSYIGIKREKLSNGDLKLSQPKLLKKLLTYGMSTNQIKIYIRRSNIYPIS